MSVNELAKIDDTNKTGGALLQVSLGDSGKPAVSGRELHDFLRVKTPYTMWFPRMCERGLFAEGRDWHINKNVSVLGNQGQSYQQADHLLSVAMAKEISMMGSTNRNKQARQYFIRIEEEYNSPEKVMARALQVANETIAAYEGKLAQLSYHAEIGRKLDAVEDGILIGVFAKKLAENGVDIGQNRLFAWFREHGYLCNQRGDNYNLPKQSAMEAGYFVLKPVFYVKRDGSQGEKFTPKLTGKGQKYFFDVFLGGTNTPAVVEEAV